MIKKVLIFCLMIMGGVVMAPLFAQGGQVGNDTGWEEEVFRASTKQVNQFFRRFNGEENPEGQRYQSTSKKYRDYKVRREYLPLLIDPALVQSQSQLVKSFFEQINDRKSPYFLDNHEDDWVAEVNCSFTYEGKPSPITLFMRLQPQGQGYEWVIEDVNASVIASRFDKDKSEAKPFIHPMSHELDFMNLNKAFRPEINPESYTSDGYEPHLLSVFLYELRTGRLAFQSVQSVRFHFFSPPGWYFEISEFNRPGMPSGWLISNLVEATETQKGQIRDYVYGR